MAESNVTPSFSDGRVIVVRADDSADCATFWDESQAGCEQTAEGPTPPCDWHPCAGLCNQSDGCAFWDSCG